ncbi:MAG: hypothetical protein ABSD13_13770 [Candidatus Korobacteraceae bacterium]|jgi:hypothetical protein
MKLIACMLAALVLLGVAFAKEHPTEDGKLVEIILTDSYPDEHMQATMYVYELTVRVGCTEYTGTYHSPQKSLMEQFRSGDALEVGVTKHRLYVTVQGLEEIMEIRLTSQRSIDKCTMSQ